MTPDQRETVGRDGLERDQAGVPAVARLGQWQKMANNSAVVHAGAALQRKATGAVLQLGRKKGRKKAKGKTMSLDAFLAENAVPREETYDALAEEGTISPRELRFSQSGCTSFFQTPFPDETGSMIRTVAEMTAALQNGTLDPQTTPPITITFFEGEIVSVDNRRLKAHKDADADIRYVKVDFDQLTENQQSHFDGGTFDNLHVR
ncbi:hypothetical protein [Roseobacter weihaiensis]|uniref:hypothetical protein n=1 Tax=Roseobacter weihaiensis TaxID=2763262 RepID=UPI001D0A60F1|nr:hypothetical protein [Roseobacter sp. H9]